MKRLSCRMSVVVPRSLWPRWTWEGEICFRSKASLSKTLRLSEGVYSGFSSTRNGAVTCRGVLS
jgi:hypothetical protein